MSISHCLLDTILIHQSSILFGYVIQIMQWYIRATPDATEEGDQAAQLTSMPVRKYQCFVDLCYLQKP